MRVHNYSDLQRDHTVDLVLAYSKQTEQIKRVRKLRALVPESWPVRPEATVVTPFRLEQRLSAAQLDELVAAYQGGTTGRQLAERFGLARSTVIALLRERGVDVRHPRVSAADAAQAVAWYREGVQQIDIAKRLGRSKSVVWHLLRRAGAL